MLDDSTTAYAVGTCALLLLASFLLLQPTGLVKWLQKKNYQYEVTFALYMLTPTEKFIFNSILFLTLSLLLLASILYLPNHIATVSRRAYYYCAGGDTQTLYSTATRATGWAANAYQAAMNKSATATAAAVASEVAEGVTEAIAGSLGA